MKAQTKALVASLVVVALALSAVSGVTYSWFSDSEEAEINVTTGKVDVKGEASDLTLYSYDSASKGLKQVQNNFTTGGTAKLTESPVKIELTNAAPGDAVRFTLKVENSSTITVKWGFNVTMTNSSLAKYITISFVTTENGTEKKTPITTGWNSMIVGPETQELFNGVLEVAFSKDAGNNVAGQNCTITLDVQAVQSNADVFSETNLEIYTVSDLYAFANLVNGGNNLEGKTVSLMANIDLEDRAWTPVGQKGSPDTRFKGTFEGNNYTISNLNIDTGTSDSAAGFFGMLNGTVQNLTIDGAKVSHVSVGNEYGQTSNGTAVIAGSIFNAGTIKKCTVKNAEVEGNRYLGGIAGYAYGNFEDCSVKNITLTATPDELTGKYDNADKVGGIVGIVPEGSFEIKNCTAENVSIKAFRDAGCLVGYVGDVPTVTGCSVKGTNSITVDRTLQEDSDKVRVGEIVGCKVGTAIDGSNSASGTVAYSAIVDSDEKLNTIMTYKTIHNIELKALAEGLYYTIPDSGKNNTWTISSTDGAVIGVHGASTNAGEYGLEGSAVTFKDIVIQQNSPTYLAGWSSSTLTFENCTINGSIHLFGMTVFENCTFNSVEDYAITTYGATEVSITDCNFNVTAKGKGAINVYSGKSDTTPSVTISECSFTRTSDDTENVRAAVQIGPQDYEGVDAWSVTIKDTKKCIGFLDTANDEGLWNVKTNNGANSTFTVTVSVGSSTSMVTKTFNFIQGQGGTLQP